MARMEDIVAMKLDIIGRGGRKKDFWDLHELQSHFDIPTMLELYQERYPYGQPREKIQKGFINFKNADDDFDPICLLGKHWELIKLDFIQWMKKVS